MSRTFPIWPSILDDIKASAHVILAVRHPLEVAHSIARRDKLELPHALGMWLRYSLEAEISTRSVGRMVSNYPDLLKDWRSTAHQLDYEFDLGLRALSERAAIRIDEFLDTGLRHQRADAEWPASVAGMPIERWCSDLYQAMLDLPAQNALDQIDKIREEVSEVEHNAQFFISQMQDDISERQRLSRAVSWLEEEKTRHLEVIEQLKRELRHREADVIVAKADYTLLNSERLTLQHEFDRQAQDIDRQAQDIRQLSADWTGAQARIAAIYQSRSWRITKPVRAISRVLRRVLPSGLPRNQQSIAAPGTPLVISDSRQDVEDDEGLPDSMMAAAIQTPEEDPAITIDAGEAGTLNQVREVSPEALRIIIATPDLHGPIRNGGIGTAFSALARWLAQTGHEVTILYTLGQYTESEPLAHWEQVYSQLGVTLLALPDELSDGGVMSIEAPQFGQIAWRIHDWLRIRENDFDLAIFPEWSGGAFHVVQAKRQQMHYHQLQIMINTHSPESWALEGNFALPESPDFLERDFMERKSVEMADWVISPSHYMLDWMRQHRWVVPVDARSIPNLPADTGDQNTLPRSEQPVTDVIFFGRLETRKGLGLFCDALDRIPENERERIGRIIFLGKQVARQGFNSVSYIEQRKSRWSMPVEIWSQFNRDQALDALRIPGSLAVIASLSENSPYTVVECLHHGIAFLASKVGGIPELIDPADRDRILFDPNPGMLASLLTRTLQDHIPTARPARSPAQIEGMWSALLGEIHMKRLSLSDAPISAHAASPLKPKVSICLVHFERPSILRQSLNSLRAQTYRNFEVILVDDGSQSPAALAMLDGLEAEFRLRDWKIIRQPNLYLGAARNRAASEASGDYLLFMDDDNIALPNEIETFVKVAQITDADILTAACFIFDTDKAPVRPNRMWIPLGNAPSVALFRNVFGDANSFWKRSSFQHVKGFSTDYGVGHEDWEIFTEAVLQGLTLEVVQEPLFQYRIHPNSMIRTGNLWVDHARSARPFLRHDPNGLGIACAYSTGLNILRHQNS
jgi:glycosyltransferase involved in cell wall biosynthesis